MIVKELVSDEILPLKTSDTCGFALAQMEENRVHHLPVVNNRELLGLISEYDITNHGSPEDPVGSIQLSMSNVSITDIQHVFDAFKMITDLKLSLLPVTNGKDAYLGIITLFNLLDHFTRNSSILNPGGIIVLEMSENDYFMGEIAHIIESNDARILNMCLRSREDSTLIEVDIKVNITDIVPILQTFQRYNYNVKATFGERDDLDDLRERYDSLMNYLNI